MKRAPNAREAKKPRGYKNSRQASIMAILFESGTAIDAFFIQRTAARSAMVLKERLKKLYLVDPFGAFSMVDRDFTDA